MTTAIAPTLAADPSCPSGLTGCWTDHSRDPDLSGSLCDAPLVIVDTRVATRVEVSANVWTADGRALPLVSVTSAGGDADEFTPDQARRLAAALTLAAELAERATR